MYLNLNGLLVTDLKQLNVLNRSFRYGDGFFESILLFNSKMPLWEYHRERMAETIAYIFSPDALQPDFDSFEQMIWALATANELQNARIRITFWRRGEGTYRAIENNYDYLIEAMPLEVRPLNRQDMVRYGYCPDIQKPMIRLSNFKTNSSLYFVMAQQYARLNDLQEVILMNTENRVCEGSYQNIFIYSDEKFRTPALSEGCINGSSRRFLIDYLKKNNIPIEECRIEKEMVESAEIVIFTTGLRIISIAKNNNPPVLTRIMDGIQSSLNL